MKRKFILPLFALLIISLITSSDALSQFTSNPNIPNPTITFLNDSVVRLDYDSIYQVHEWWDTVQYPQAIGNIRNTVTGKYDYARIFADLMTALDAREYHFIPIYADDDLRYGEIPGWIHSGSPNRVTAKNIGANNNVYDESPLHAERGNNYRMLHMNDIKFLDRPYTNQLGSMPNWGSTITLFHEIGHSWGVFWNTGVGVLLGWSTLNWQPWMPSITLVADVETPHWYGHIGNRWVNPINAGLLPSGPSINRFNIFDLYAMGALSYNKIVDSVLYVRDTSTLIEYPVTVDSLIATLNKVQNYLDNTPPEELPDNLEDNEYMKGDGKRIPATDPNTQNFKTLIVLVTGKESIFTKSDRDLVLKLAKDVPPDWEIATRGYSHMSTKLEHKMVNDFTVPIFNSSLDITLKNFNSGYNPYIKGSPDGIRIESLPLSGSLSFNGLVVSAGQVFNAADFAFGHLIYNKAPGKRFVSAEFKWNAITNGRWAVPAKVKIVPPLTPIAASEPQNSMEEGITVKGNNGTVVSVFPNPFGKTLQVSVTNSSEVSFKIVLYDMQGNARYQKTIHTKDTGTRTIVVDNIPDEITGLLNLAITLEGNILRRTILRNSESER